MTIIFSEHAKRNNFQRNLNKVMKMYYDKTVDAVDIVFKDGFSAKTIELSPEVMLDVDSKGTPLSLEIIGASKKYPKFEIKDLKFEFPLSAYQPKTVGTR